MTDKPINNPSNDDLDDSDVDALFQEFEQDINDISQEVSQENIDDFQNELDELINNKPKAVVLALPLYLIQTEAVLKLCRERNIDATVLVTSSSMYVIPRDPTVDCESLVRDILPLFIQPFGMIILVKNLANKISVQRFLENEEHDTLPAPVFFMSEGGFLEDYMIGFVKYDEFVTSVTDGIFAKIDLRNAGDDYVNQLTTLLAKITEQSRHVNILDLSEEQHSVFMDILTQMRMCWQYYDNNSNDE